VPEGTGDAAWERLAAPDTGPMTSIVDDRARPTGPDAPVDPAGEAVLASPVRAWSRAGAIAELAAVVPPARIARGSARVALVATGSAVVALSVAVTLWTGLGPGPLDVFIGAVRARTGLPLGLALWAVIGSIIALAWALGRRPGPATLVGPLVVGPVMQFGVGVLDTVDVPDVLALRLLIHVVAIAGIGLGAGAIVASGLGAGSAELLAIAASDRTGRSRPRVRLVVEITWLAFGVVLGGPIGLGTVLVALTIGPAVEGGYRVVHCVVQCVVPGAVRDAVCARSALGAKLAA
jgi:uncharacterized membrane protein YczE